MFNRMHIQGVVKSQKENEWVKKNEHYYQHNKFILSDNLV